MGIGKLYNADGEQFVGDIHYQLQNASPTNWWGELTLVEYQRISDGDDYVIELEDNRKGRCYLKKRINRAVSGVPPRYVYYFAGVGDLQ